MYLNSRCPHCGARIRRISIYVVKPGVITCRACKKMAVVTGMLKGFVAYLTVWFGFCFLIAPLKYALNDDWVALLFFGYVFFAAIYTMSLFLDLEK